MLLVLPVAALQVTYQIGANGTDYHAEAVVNGTDRFEFVQSGMLGERIPLSVRNVTLFQNGVNTTYTQERGGITFPKGNYSIIYDGVLSGNTFQSQLPEPGSVSIILPDRYKVDNPLLTSLQPGGSRTNRSENQTVITWDTTRYFDVRFYDANQENLLGIFAQFWLIIAVMLLLPFVFSRRRQG
ncbi:MAG: DUF5803 family protein [Methanospirillum sp.]|uniref:DUF5803 family protein n=1 Tax=Methanospirillum sp. TaxID=45200 RepID=UPI00237583E6|nr:DUF5803 family protein [Methanospirillum sp.]MDD1729746.1 DUF5803 family protein [Methanospirillum sp.]